jgi:hypothetical protein|tara:strand:- start:457 stop:702 length:246 start_codon:yes stop_codon:yes gene_type:complete
MKNYTLYDQLKPEVKQALTENQSKYKFSVNKIIDKLKSTRFYGDLTIDDISSIHTFSHIETLRVSAWDFRYGDHLFNTYND